MSSPIVLYRSIFYKFRLVLVSHCTGLNLSVVFKYLFFNCHIFKYILHSCQRNSWWNCHLPSTHYLPFVKLSTAVGCGHDGTAHLQVPGLVSILCGAGDGYSVDTAGVTITWTVITLLTTVSGCPNKNGSQAFAPLCDIKKRKSIILREFCSEKFCVVFLTDQTFLMPCSKACLVSGPGPSTVFPSSFGPQLAL